MYWSDLILNYYALIASVIIIITIIHYKLKFNVWSSLGVPGPTPIPALGAPIDVFFDSMPNIFLKYAAKYGRVYGLYRSFGTTLVVSDPQVIKQVCVKDFHIFTNRRVFRNFHEILAKMLSITVDDEWRRLRKIISPTFSTAKIKRMKPLVECSVRNAMEYLEMVASTNKQLDLKQFWSRFTLEVIARCCFAIDLNAHKDPNNEFLHRVTNFFKPSGFIKITGLILFLILPVWVTKRLPVKFFAEDDVDYFKNIVRRLLSQRRNGETVENDFLQLLVEAEKENKTQEEPGLTENEIIANCILFFVAGHETTANLLQWICYSLAMNTDIQDKLIDEIKANFADAEDINYDLANKLPYLDAVISETLRMYPSLLSIERTAKIQVELENIGIKIPAKSIVQIPVYSMHRDAEFFSEPDLFKPERFLGDNGKNIDPYTYLPFGCGPRNCVAMRFALIEAKLAIIRTMLSFKIERSTGTPEKLEFARFSNFLLCKNNVSVNIIKR